MTRKTFRAHEYQQRAIDWIIAKDKCALFLDMGLGKTVITLTAFDQLRQLGEVTRALVIAPSKVADGTWSAEAAKWTHLDGITVGDAVGTAAQRAKVIDADPDVLVIGRDNFHRFCKEYGKQWRWDFVVIDELSGFKHQSSKRWKAFKTFRQFMPRIVGLTGTPAANGYKDLWGQMHCLDGGARLGKYEGWYIDKYFSVYRHNNIPIRFTLIKGAEDDIRDKISDICLAMRAEDYLTLPSISYIDYPVHLPPKLLKQYKTFERDKILEAIDGADAITADNAMALASKLGQMANGFIYDEREPGAPHATALDLHTAKVDSLRDIVEAAGEPVLVFYQYKHDVETICKALTEYKPEVYQGADTLARWNSGNIRLLLAHPASCSCGLNLQHGGRYIVWYSTGYNLEHYQQANARLHRQGQTRPVIVYHLLSQGTIDEKMLAALQGKCTLQEALLDGLKIP